MDWPSQNLEWIELRMYVTMHRLTCLGQKVLRPLMTTWEFGWIENDTFFQRIMCMVIKVAIRRACRSGAGHTESW